MATFHGIFADLLRQYIDFKRNLGYKYTSEARYCEFDRFCIEQNWTKIGLTKELFDLWGARRPNEKESNQYHRINEIANFSKYLNSLGLESFVPRVNFRGRSNFVPYIFSYEEIERFFIACDQILITSYTIQGSISPALFRLLYGCGLRISEALSLAYHDVNLNERFLIVRSSKNTTERVLPFTDSVFEVLSAYKNYRNRLNVSSDYFFIKKNGEKCTPDAAYRSFRTVLIAAGIPHGGKNQGPRLHDIRYPNLFNIQTF